MKQRVAFLVTCDGRLSARQDLFEKLAEEVRSCFTSGRETGKIENLEFKIVKLPEELRIHSDQEAAIALKPYLSTAAHYFVFSNSFTLIVGCESSERDRVLKAIYAELKHGADQLSKTRPGLLACFIEDIYDEDWSQLTSNSGLANMTHNLMASPQRNHVNFVAYSSDHTPPKQEGPFIDFAATNLRFDNLNPKYPLSKSFLKPDR